MLNCYLHLLIIFVPDGTMDASVDRLLVSVWSTWEKLEVTWSVRVWDNQATMPYRTLVVQGRSTILRSTQTVVTTTSVAENFYL